ncbi:MAG: fimbrillin family protein [Alistipes indistinctus]
MSFFAYSPHAAAANGITPNVTTGIPTISYTVPTNCSDQPDLMVAALVADRNKTNNGSAPVNFQMRHALTCIGFKASGNGQQITKLEIQGGYDRRHLDNQCRRNILMEYRLLLHTGKWKPRWIRLYTRILLSQLVNTGGGYLMMIPQTLPAGARLIGCR